jgi:phosphoribosylanthranilate isomerase
LAQNVRVLRALPAAKATPEEIGPWTELGATLLLDGPTPGSGQSFRWREFGVPGTEFFVAGGLDPANVADAIRITGATGVDAATGVERGGRIAADLVTSFVLAARRSSERVR